jgi:hypothetical protein
MCREEREVTMEMWVEASSRPAPAFNADEWELRLLRTPYLRITYANIEVSPGGICVYGYHQSDCGTVPRDLGEHWQLATGDQVHVDWQQAKEWSREAKVSRVMFCANCVIYQRSAQEWPESGSGRTEGKTGAVCPNDNLTIPLTGICDECGWSAK